MKKSISKKIEGGKLVQLDLDYGLLIDHLQITGDFFAHPEDSIEQIENLITGKPASISKEALQNIIETYVKENNVEFVGVTTEALVAMIMGAIK